jgi:hypothetical protein
MPFFTAVDSRAEVKGSRDPLGLVPGWSRLGRRFVGNLTTVSSSARGFTTLLVGYYLAERVAEEHSERELDVFLRFEQVAAYTRLYIHGDSDFRGTRRAERTRSSTSRPPIGAASDRQILSDQKTYGLWGLYSMPARSSGLLRLGEPRLTRDGLELVEQHCLLPVLARGRKLQRQLVSLVRHDGTYSIDGQHAELAAALGEVLAPRFSGVEREAFEYHLVRGGPDDRTGGAQAQLSALLRRLPPTQPFGIEPLKKLIGEAGRRAGHETLARHLEDALRVEQVIVPLQAAFLFALSRDGRPLHEVASEIAATWAPLTHVDASAMGRVVPDIQAAYGDNDAGERMVRAAEALAAGDFESLLRTALEHNQYVMRVRNGSEPWVRLDGGRLVVRYHDETDTLPERQVLPGLWRSTYFIDALKRVINQIDA